jgi:hypothetical protein
MRTSIAYLLIALLTPLLPCAQQTNDYWYFGSYGGIYFDSAGVHPFPGNVFAAEGTASISDGCGLLFYTDGDTVWNARQQMMPGGFDIGGKCATFQRSSSTQAALVVRQPASDSLFYIFTTDCIEDELVDGLHYSIVNMHAQGGLGEVIVKNQPLFQFAEEKLTAVRHANGCDIWIIAHRFATEDFYVYSLTDLGLNPIPMVIGAGQSHNCNNPLYPEGRGYLKASPDGNWLINVNPDGAYSFCDTVLPELFSFDRLTGNISPALTFPADSAYWWPVYSAWTIPYYGATFSPDNSKLYLSSGFYGPHIFQYDLQAGSDSAILASRTLLSPHYPWPSTHWPPLPCSMANGPDGKIYVSHLDRNFLGVIQNPNAPGLACNYVDSAVTLGNGPITSWGGLPNFFEDYINPRLFSADFSYSQSVVGDTVFFSNQSIAATDYTWYFGDGTTSTLQNPIHVYPDTGYYDVSLYVSDGSCDVDRMCLTVYVGPATDIDAAGDGRGPFVWPNPFSDQLHVHAPQAGTARIFLSDMMGRAVLQEEFDGDGLIGVAHLPSGIYLYELCTVDGGRIRGRVVKE